MNLTLKLCVFLLFSIGAYGQSEYPHILVFKDGSEIRGKVVVWDRSKVVFREANTSEKESYKYKSLKSILDFDTRKEYEGLFVLRQLKGTDKTLRLKKAISGKVDCLYIPREISSAAFGSDAVTVTSMYYLSKEEDGNEVIKIRSGLQFKKTKKLLIEYFKDCPDLISKIEEGYFDDNIEALEPIVKYYNTKC
ncbi:hypothetical protein [uncultured Aquimarina sp.]|uniref:hypothetical protein n=1 Tax=uncultured Aquimarina sp. TaxID=575652 RepID=UPI00261C092F|nr:hypothetical protein [uncultured Aquimarina sp.]